MIGIKDEKPFIKSLASQLASKVSADSAPIAWDLIRLYALAKEGEKAMNAINAALSRSLGPTGPKIRSGEQDTLVALAEKTLRYLKELGLSPPGMAETCKTLVELRKAQRMAEAEQWSEALNVSVRKRVHEMSDH